MNDERLDHVFRTARQAAPDTARVEFGFETRLLARLRAERASSELNWLAWTRRLAPIFAAIVLGLGAWNLIALNAESTDLQTAIGISHEEITELAPFDGQ